MNDWLFFYQNIPLHVDPIALSVGSFSLGWYAMMYGLAFAVVYLLLIYRIKKDVKLSGTADYFVQGIYKTEKSRQKLIEIMTDLIIFAVLGAIIGGRLGYVVFYDAGRYWANPWEIISPYDPFSGEFIGIYGMSYHGGLMGVILTSWFFAKKNRLNFWKWTDLVLPAVPAGYFFGRVGNFLNLELYGRKTESLFGMYFPADIGNGEYLRFPSQLIEASLEGLLLFIVFWSFRNNRWLRGKFLPIYLISYGAVRIIGEFFREPDEQIGYIFSFFTLGQVFSLLMIMVGIILYCFQKKKIIV